MAKIVVNKSNPLKGHVKIDGAKNAVLPIIAATLLAKGKSSNKRSSKLKMYMLYSKIFIKTLRSRSRI